jgi:hypothetical protein
MRVERVPSCLDETVGRAAMAGNGDARRADHDGDVQPVGWIGEWHENPKPQWIIPLSGRWFVEAMDGTRVEMGPGELSFGGDQNCRARDGRVGHRSGTIGDSPATLIVVQFDSASAPRGPCGFR